MPLSSSVSRGSESAHISPKLYRCEALKLPSHGPWQPLKATLPRIERAWTPRYEPSHRVIGRGG
jgi:hypothetical protein